MSKTNTGHETKAPTIRDVANLAGVSPATVSRVLNGHRVDPEMVTRVDESVAKLGYRPSRVARSLRSRTAKVWGLIIGDIRNSFFTQMARGIEDVAADAGYSVVLCNTDEDLAKEASYIDLVLDEHMAGCIITPAQTENTDISALIHAGIPLVTVDRVIRDVDVDTVTLDNRSAAASATRHLLNQGFQRVGCITGPESTTTGKDRAQGYLDVVGPSDDLLLWSDFQSEGGYSAAQSLLTLEHPPDAILVGNNQMMIGTLRAIRDLGLSPYDVGLVCFDELEWAELTEPSLSTIGQPTYELGKEAATQLLARIDGDNSPTRQIVLKALLMARRSSIRRT